MTEKATKQIFVALAILLGTALCSGFVKFNSWSWEMEALAADVGSVQYQLVKKRLADTSQQIYELERTKDRDPSWNERDDARLRQLETELDSIQDELDLLSDGAD